MIILLGSQKGGCGKSTLSTNIAAALASQGKDVILVDADRQGTASNWIAERETLEGVPTVFSVQKYDSIKTTLLDLASRYEYVVVDSAGRDSAELRSALLAADLLIIPSRPSQADLDTLDHVAKMVTMAKDFNEGLKVKVVLTMCPTNPSIKELEQSKEYLADFPEFELTGTFISDRKIYRDALSDGKGVIELDNKKAKNEITSLINEVVSG